MPHSVPLKLSLGTRLLKSSSGTYEVEVIDVNERYTLPWDRFLRLGETAKWLSTSQCSLKILDVGGFDGSLKMFLPSEATLDVVDPAISDDANTVLKSLPERSYPIVTAIDVLEHVPPSQRQEFLRDLIRITQTYCFINFPNQSTASAQSFVYSLTGNQFVKEHVEYGLPDEEEVKKTLESLGFSCESVDYGSCAMWISQFALQTTVPEVASKVNQYLFTEHPLPSPSGPPELPLYTLLRCRRMK
jgi:hypothetical protein